VSVAAHEQLATAALIKPNQVGTVTDARRAGVTKPRRDVLLVRSGQVGPGGIGDLLATSGSASDERTYERTPKLEEPLLTVDDIALPSAT
jgi:hypothetical protein